MLFFFFNDTATTEIYTLSLHDALPISLWLDGTLDDLWSRVMLRSKVISSRLYEPLWCLREYIPRGKCQDKMSRDRKSTRLNSSHANISYAVFCLKKKKKKIKTNILYI